MKNIREIAKLSGVSTATVSRYVNKRGNTAPKTGEKIQQIIDKYGYNPNKLTTAIINGRLNDIGVIVQNVSNPYFSQLLDEITKYALLQNLNVVICNARGSRAAEKQHYQELTSKRVSGIIVINTTDEQTYLNCSIPLIALEKRILDFPKLKVDNRKGIQLLINNFSNLNQKKLLVIKSKTSNQSSKERISEVETKLNELKVNYQVQAIDDNFEDIELANVMLKKYDVVMCWNDMIAHAIVAKAINENIKLGEELEITGFDGLKLNNIFPYKLTTIHQNISKLGEESFSMLLELINNKQIQDVILDVKIEIGNTTKQ